MLLTSSESPVVVVLSGSMEPAFQRGDILFLDNTQSQIQVGDIVVFKIKDRDIPIVHRVLQTHESNVTGALMLTKGDNNYLDDRSGRLYNRGQMVSQLLFFLFCAQLVEHGTCVSSIQRGDKYNIA